MEACATTRSSRLSSRTSSGSQRQSRWSWSELNAPKNTGKSKKRELMSASVLLKSVSSARLKPKPDRRSDVLSSWPKDKSGSCNRWAASTPTRTRSTLMRVSSLFISWLVRTAKRQKTAKMRATKSLSKQLLLKNLAVRTVSVRRSKRVRSRWLPPRRSATETTT